MDIAEKKLFYINSNNRISGSHSDFHYRLDMKGVNPDQIVCLQANIPKSYYMVQEGYNTFTLFEGITSATITVPIGNYNRLNFKTTIQTLLNDASPNLWVYSVSIPPVTGADNGKYIITVTGNTSQPALTFTSGNLYELMGFAVGIFPFVGDALESPHVVKLQKEDCIYINSDIVSGESEGVLQEIYSVNSSDFDNVVFVNQNVDLYSKQMNGNGNNTYRFFLTNENGEVMNLNGQNFTMTLCAYKRDLTNEMVRQYIKYRIKNV